MSADSQTNDGAWELITNSFYHVKRVTADNSLFNAQVERVLQSTIVKHPINCIKTQFTAIGQGTVHKQIIGEQNT